MSDEPNTNEPVQTDRESSTESSSAPQQDPLASDDSAASNSPAPKPIPPVIPPPEKNSPSPAENTKESIEPKEAQSEVPPEPSIAPIRKRSTLSTVWRHRYKIGAGGLVALGILLGAWLKDLIDLEGFGVGDGDGGAALSSGDDDDDNLDDVVAVAPDNNDKVVPFPNELLNVLIGKDRYYVLRRVGSKLRYRPADLDEIADLAAKTQPDEQGRRVQFEFTHDANVGAVDEFKNKLFEVGISETAIEELNRDPSEGPRYPVED